LLLHIKNQNTSIKSINKFSPMCFKSPVIILLFILCACSTPYNEKTLYGTWEGHNSHLKMVITFSNDGTCTIEYGGLSNDPLKEITGKYKVEFTKKPVPLSITDIPQINHPLHTIMEFQNNDLIKLGVFAPRWRLRPISFSKDSEIFLRRRI
jgi:hypothetical protein